MTVPMQTAERRRGPSSVTELDVAQARALAARLLVDLPERWRHTISVVARAQELRDAVPPVDREVLHAAAWLHDVGYSPQLARTGFHPLDGARFLLRQGWPVRVCGLVAHHSGARFLARFHGLHLQLDAYDDEHSRVTDALAYADQTVGAHGERLALEERLTDMLRRHGPDSPNALAHPDRAPYLRAAALRVEHRLGLASPSRA